MAVMAIVRRRQPLLLRSVAAGRLDMHTGLARKRVGMIIIVMKGKCDDEESRIERVGKARQGKLGKFDHENSRIEWVGKARQDKARHGKARQGMARHGKARHGPPIGPRATERATGHRASHQPPSGPPGHRSVSNLHGNRAESGARFTIAID